MSYSSVWARHVILWLHKTFSYTGGIFIIHSYVICYDICRALFKYVRVDQPLSILEKEIVPSITVPI